MRLGSISLATDMELVARGLMTLAQFWEKWAITKGEV